MSRLFLTLIVALACVPAFGGFVQHDSGITAELQALEATWEADPLNPDVWPWSLAIGHPNGSLPYIAYQDHTKFGGQMFQTTLVGGLPVSVRVTETIGLGTGFAAAQKMPHVMGAVWADVFNNDGLPDLIPINGALTTQIKSDVNLGGGMFAANTFKFAAGFGVREVDLNLDGWSDLEGFRPVTAGVQRYQSINNQNGTFTNSNALVPHPAGLPLLVDDWVTAKEAGNGNNQTKLYNWTDLDGVGGDDDLVIDWFPDRNSGGGITGNQILLNVAGTLTSTIGIPDNVFPIYWGDLTGDGLTDVLTGAGPAASVGVWVQQTAGVFARVANPVADAWLAFKSKYYIEAEAANFDCDPELEILVTRNSDLGSIVLDLADALGHVNIALSIDSNGGFPVTGIADFDGNGTPDIAALMNGGGVNMYLSEACELCGMGGHGTIPEPPSAALALLALFTIVLWRKR